MAHPFRGSRRGQSGVALLLAIWVLALLAVITASVTADVSTSLKLTANAVEISRARASADAGVWEAIALLRSDAAAGLLLDGTPQTLPLAGQTVSVAIQDEAGKIDINQASAKTLAALMRTAGVETRGSERLAQSIVAFRQRAEATITGFSPGTPPTPVFLTPEELKLVPGMSAELYARLAPFVTTYGADWRVNPSHAPLPVLEALFGHDRQALASFLKLRQAKRGDEAALQAMAPAAFAAGARWQRPHVVTIVSSATTPDGAIYVRRAVVDLAPASRRQFQIIAWTPVR